jgi:protease-4
MPRFVKLAVAAALLACASRAAAQIQNALERQAGIPAGIALPVPGAAAAEEPAALGANPAAVGFVGRPALQYFHEANVTEGGTSDGLYGATLLGPIGLGYSVEWMRPGTSGGPAAPYRRGVLALSLGDGESASLGVGWNTYWSSDSAIDSLAGWSAGLTLRPARQLSIAAVTLDRDAWLGSTKLPARYDFGVGLRVLRDDLTLTGDVVADDQAKDSFHVNSLNFGVGYEGWNGLGLGAQVLVPIGDTHGASHDPSFVAVVSFNAAHAGLSGGPAGTPSRTGWLAGVRFSGERYPGPNPGQPAPTIEIERELDPERVPFLDLGDPDPYGTLLERLEAVAADDSVPAVAVRIGDLPLGPGRIEELRAALVRIGARKPVLAYLTGGRTKEYWLATAATGIAMPPGQTLDVSGYSTSRLYLREALGRAGIAFEVIAMGAYKSAPEQLVRDAPSAPARENVESLLDDGFGRLVADVAAARRLPPEKVRALVDEALFGAREAQDAGLVDAVLWPDEVRGWLRTAAGQGLALGGPYRPAPVRQARRWGRPPVIEVVRVDGTIVPGRSRGGMLFGAVGADTVVAQLRAAAADPEVKAIVLRIESPGGDGLASDLIWRAVQKAREKKPVVASMGDVAASGGYLAAAAAETIVAEPTTLTGSIGVFVLKPELSGLLQKLGVTRVAFSRGELAQLESIAKPWSEKERKAIERQIEAFYGIFVDRVAEGRKLPRDKVEAVAGGRVWSGGQAMERGLVDRLGTLDDAVAIAVRRAGLSRADVEVRRAGTGLRDAFANAPALDAGPLGRALGAVPEVRALAALAEMGPILALPLEWAGPVR